VGGLLEKHPKILQANLNNCTKDKFMPLQSALKSGSHANVATVVGLLEKHPEILKANLMQHNRFEFNCLHQAANSGNYAFVQQVVSLIEQVFPEESASVISELKKEDRKFQTKAWQNPEIKAFLNKFSSQPYRSNENRDFYPSGGYRQQGNASSNHARNSNSDRLEKKRPFSSTGSHESRATKIQKRVYT
jgi:hypothetical protein